MASLQQLNALMDFLETNKELALGRLTRSKEGRSLTKRLWAECSIILNSISSDCVSKTPDQWRVYFNEFKSKLLKKIKLEKAEIGATGGGPSKRTPLTPLQERLYEILGRDVGEPLPGVRHDPLSQHDNFLEGLEVVESALPLARPLSVEIPSPAEEETIVVIEIAPDSLPSTDQQPKDPLPSTSRDVASGTTAVTSGERTTGPTPSTDRMRQATSGATRRRRRRPSPVSRMNRDTENQPGMREAAEQLERMERFSAEATHALAQATHRQAAALEEIAEGLRNYVREITETRRSARSSRRLNRNLFF